MNDNNLLKELRAATSALHERIEQQNLAQAILDHSMALETYKILLLLNYQAYLHLESRLINFLPQLKADKAARLKRDLEALEVVLPDPSANPSFELNINSGAEAFGAAYVVEGSALGGMLIARHLPQCEQLKELPPQHFFSGDKASLAAWNVFKQELANQDFKQAEVQALLAKAWETFLFFESVYQSYFPLTSKNRNKYSAASGE